MDVSYILNEETRRQGITLEEPDDHILVLSYHSKTIARFSQTGTELKNSYSDVIEKHIHDTIQYKQ